MVVFDKDMAEANPDLVTRNLSQDTKELNHCVGSCGHGTAAYPNRHVPMVEPHTGTTPKGSDASYGPNYIRKIKEGQIQIASLRGPNGESKATLELNPDVKMHDRYALDSMVIDWLDNYKQDYLTFYENLKSSNNIPTAINRAKVDIPELAQYLADLEKKTQLKVSQIKGENNRQLKPDAVEAVKLWLNSKGNQIASNRISDLDNLPGVVDLRNTKPHEIADEFYSIHPDKLNNFLNELVNRRLESNETLKDLYYRGLRDPIEILSEDIHRFVTKDDLIKVAEENGFDIQRRPEDSASEIGAKFTDLQKMVFESAVNDFHNGIDLGELTPEYHDNINELIFC